MIKANELRIGNCVFEMGIDYIGENPIVDKDDKKLIIVDLEVLKNIIEFNYTTDYNIYEPIPLTPEILDIIPIFKKWTNSNTYELETKNGNIQIRGNEVWIGGIDACTSGMGFTLIIDSLHQLQNICLDLTGEELEIKFTQPEHSTAHNQIQ